MAKKDRFAGMVDDDVMEAVDTEVKPSGSPVTKELHQSHQKATEVIAGLQASLEEERRRRSDLESQIRDSNGSGTDAEKIEKAVAEAKRVSEEREQTLVADLESANSQLEILEQQLKDAPEDGVYKLDPTRVRQSKFANRSLLAFSDKPFDQLRVSIKRYNGNDIPAKVRPVSGDPDFDYEVVYGHRRHKATLLEATPFFAKIADISDAELVQLMHVENQREDLSAFEEAFQFQQWLAEGFYDDATTLAADIGESKSFVSQRMAIIDLPRIIFNALKDPRQLGITAWRDICVTYRSDRDAVIQAASDFASDNDDLELADKAEVFKIYRKLVSGNKPRPKEVEVKYVTLPRGTPLFKSEKKASGYSVKFDSTGVVEDIQQEAIEELERFLRQKLSKQY
jgi:ParB/RepB/Spo0J family partition protein